MPSHASTCSALGRLAPSPTGAMHLGNARTALLAWLWARRSGGRVVLRYEDLDRARVVPGAEEQITEDLKALGLDWDPPVVRQSQRIAMYDEALERLRNQGLIYPCACSRADMARAASAPQGVQEGTYPGICSGLDAKDVVALAKKNGRDPAWRFRGQQRSLRFDDAIAGRYEGLVDDFVVKRSDGVYAYQLAVVVDDAAQGVNQVLRGDDLLSSTAKQIALLRALGQPIPHYAHAPLVLSAQGARLEKRKRPQSLRELLNAGITPAHIVGVLAASAGLCPPGSHVTPHELVKDFAPQRVHKDPVCIDIAKSGKNTAARDVHG